jgi:hypothetical protein
MTSNDFILQEKQRFEDHKKTFEEYVTKQRHTDEQRAKTLDTFLQLLSTLSTSTEETLKKWDKFSSEVVDNSHGGSLEQVKELILKLCSLVKKATDDKEKTQSQNKRLQEELILTTNHTEQDRKEAKHTVKELRSTLVKEIHSNESLQVRIQLLLSEKRQMEERFQQLQNDLSSMERANASLQHTMDSKLALRQKEINNLRDEIQSFRLPLQSYLLQSHIGNTDSHAITNHESH